MSGRGAALVVLVLTTAAHAAPPLDWPQWRGPARTGIAAGPLTARWRAGARVYVHSRVGADEVVSAFDLAAGHRVWRHTQAVAYTPTSAAAGHGRGPKATPLLHQGRLYAFGVTGIPTAPGGPAYASPVIATLDGVRQVVTLTQTHLVGVSAANGTLLWSAPFTTMYDQNAVTPVVSGNVVIVSGVEKGVRALRIDHDGGRWTTRPAWENNDVSFYMSSPVVTGARLLGFSQRQKGQVVSLDAATGRLRWAGPGRLLVLKADADRFAPVATYAVGDGSVWAHLAVAPHAVLVKDRQTLSLWRVP